MYEEDQEILNHFIHVLPLLNDLLTNDISVGLADLEKQLLYIPSKTLDLKVPKDAPLKPGSGLYRAVHEKHRVITKGDKALWGIPFISVAIPIYNSQGKIIGAAVANETVDRQENLKQMATSLADNITVLSSTSQEISAQTEEISAVCSSLSELVQKSQVHVKETDEVLELIKRVANQTNLLGLNAAIEAARVGEQGRGFGVVAEEIRKLANESADSIKRIDAILKAIQSGGSETANQMLEIDSAVSQVAIAIEEVARAAQEANVIANELDTLADELSADNN